ncbi:MAG TPA: DUF4258 domain-containing protein [Sedimentisphaerales bacterium]|nr:DUF4258 domain-containing protein [Sedimentisphaerales bacterium]
MLETQHPLVLYWCTGSVPSIGRKGRKLPRGKWYDAIRRLVAEEKYVVGEHAVRRLEERGILEWQAVSGLEDGKLLLERPDDKPNPAIEVQERLPDGTEFKAVWSYLSRGEVGKLVTVRSFDEL